MKKPKAADRRAYARDNLDWLTAKAAEPGVTPLPGGALYRVIASGDSSLPSPTLSSVVTVSYTGTTIDGHIFDTTEGTTPPAFRLADLIAGWQTALTRMHPGDRWELYLPASLAYGRLSQPDIPADSTLIFDLTLHSAM